MDTMQYIAITMHSVTICKVYYFMQSCNSATCIIMFSGNRTLYMYLIKTLNYGVTDFNKDLCYNNNNIAL